MKSLAAGGVIALAGAGLFTVHTAATYELPVVVNAVATLWNPGSQKPLDSVAHPDVRLSGSDDPGMWASFDEMHDEYTRAFVESEGFGIRRVIDFDSPERRLLLVDGVLHRVSSTLLIGLRESGSVVYTSPWGGVQRAHLDTYETREATADELAALSRLAEGTDFVWSDSAGVMTETANGGTLIAPLHAAESCLQCHSAEYGDLLGAFVYTMEETPESLRLLEIPLELLQPQNQQESKLEIGSMPAVR